MKKYLSLLIAALLIIGSLSACGSGNPSSDNASSGSSSSDNANPGSAPGGKNKDKIQIVTTIFPEYDWVMNILGDNPGNAEVTMLLDNGVDLHSYQPTADDILKISTCDLFVYVGGESDEWVKDVLSEAINKDMVVINMLDVLGSAVKEEEVVEGMQEEGEHKHDHDEDEHSNGEDADHDKDEYGHEEDADHDEKATDEHGNGGEEVEYDEHVWLSLRNAAVLCDSIAEAIKSIDPDNAPVYSGNVSIYKEKLTALDSAYKDAVAGAEIKTLLFGDRFPFRYLVDDYGLNYYAAFVGCSAETEASFETIVFLANKVDELGLRYVLTIEGQNHSIAETIIQNTRTKDQKILTMDSMQGTTTSDVGNGASYLSIMEANLAVLKDALKGKG